jgi:hypothetical protein
MDGGDVAASYETISALLELQECDDLIRIGSRHDGGYVHSLQIARLSDGLLSFGIDLNWDFEKDFQVLSHCKHIHAYDNSISRPALFLGFINEVRKKAQELVTTRKKKGIGIARAMTYYSDFCATFAPPNKFFRETIGMTSIKGHSTVSECLSRMQRKGCHQIFLKCDIEGAEYEIIPDICENSEGITGLIVEFHDIGSNIKKFQDRLTELKNSFVAVHYHINNFYEYHGMKDLHERLFAPIEVSFINRSLARSPRPSIKSYPVFGLDWPNIAPGAKGEF